MDFLKELFNSSKIKVALENNRLRAELDKQKDKVKEYKEKYLHFEKQAEEYADKWRSSKKDLALANEELRKLKKEGKYGK